MKRKCYVDKARMLKHIYLVYRGFFLKLTNHVAYNPCIMCVARGFSEMDVVLSINVNSGEMSPVIELVRRVWG